MSGVRRYGSPHVGDHVHYRTFKCDPCDRWARVINAYDGPHFVVRMLDTGDVERTECNYKEIAGKGHLTLWIEPPDGFFVWQAKLALLGGDHE